jgi:hypothetical protein
MYQMRRGHVPQISISDDNHHVTEAIGDLYGGDSDSARPLSFVPSPNGDSIQSFGAFEPFDPFPAAPPARSPLRPQVTASSSASSVTSLASTPAAAAMSAPAPVPQKRPSLSHHASPQGPLSPPLSRTNSDTAEQQFPLNDLDYESSPAGLAQELSNLQAIRRMSMGVNNADPDLPSFKSNGPPSPPALSDDEDPTKLFWVPARLHPELEPRAFKSFIEDKVNTIRRRSGDSDSLSPDGALGRETSGGGLRRKKSMLSRQIDSGSGYRDGAERLERQRSVHQSDGGLGSLQELEHIVEDPADLVRRISISSKDAADGPAEEVDNSLVPRRFGGIGTLKRSTHTNYRRGSLRKGGPPLSRRLGGRQAETDTEESPSTSPTYLTDPDAPPLPISRVQSEPVNGGFEGPSSNFSRPRRRSPPGAEPRPGSAEDFQRPASSEQAAEEQPRPKPKAFHSRIASNGRTSAHLPGYKPPTLQSPVPQIVETPPPQEADRRQQFSPPERLSSRQPPPQQQQQQQQLNGSRNYPQQQLPIQQRQSSQNRPNRHAQAAQASPIQPQQSFEDLVQHPSPLPGGNSRIDNLSIIPNLPDEKKPEKSDKSDKSEKKSKDKKEASDGSRKTSWGWLVGGDKEKEREKKEREKEEREKEVAKKVKNKLSKTQEKGHDDTRLDLLQASIQGSQRGRESIVIDRDNTKLEEERKKESNRKSSTEGKKEKEPSLLSSIFGGGKKKGEKEASSKKASSRGVSPEPPPKTPKPDIDYNWTRFSILEERAIYRMAHIKLANPRRELYSQVLLSNFMYSYLAKVQQMHPQIQIGNSKQARQAQQQQQAAQQKKEQQQHQPQEPQQTLQPQQPQQPQHQQTQNAQPQQQSRHQQSQSQPEEFAQYQRYQQVGQPT